MTDFNNNHTLWLKISQCAAHTKLTNCYHFHDMTRKNKPPNNNSIHQINAINNIKTQIGLHRHQFTNGLVNNVYYRYYPAQNTFTIRCNNITTIVEVIMYSGVITIFAALFIGYCLVIKQPIWQQRINSLTSQLILVILFLMGLSLANLDNLSQNLTTIALYTGTLFIIIASCNVVSLPLLDKLLPLNTHTIHHKLPISSMALESAKLIIVVALGLMVGLMFSISTHWVEIGSEGILLLLLFLIGIQLRNSGLTLRQIILNKHGMLIALFVITSSWLGGLISAYLLDIPWSYGLAMASGFGWYSLSGILMADALGPVYGGASFMLELLRELVALIMIPLFIRRYPCTSIGYAGATAMDFTLPVIQNTGGVKCVPVAIVSGFILSLSVPFFMLFFISLAQ